MKQDIQYIKIDRYKNLDKIYCKNYFSIYMMKAKVYGELPTCNQACSIKTGLYKYMRRPLLFIGGILYQSLQE